MVKNKNKERKPRVVSLVPSWTETLITAGIPVVGRTRFCIHPGKVVSSIPVVGGTKDINWNKVRSAEPDWVLFDREENTLEMAEACPFPKLVTDVRSISDCARDLGQIASQLDSTKLRDVAERWQAIAKQAANRAGGDAGTNAGAATGSGDGANRPGISSTAVVADSPIIPGIQDWISPAPSDIERLVYLIWKDPWMTVSTDTFIGSMLAHLGLSELHKRGLESIASESRYPEIDLEQLPESTLLLYSSEPYPFEKKREDLPARPGALVDGEIFSWFGIRSLEFLEGRS